MKRFYRQWTQESVENFLGFSSLPTTNLPFYITLSNILTHMCIILQVAYGTCACLAADKPITSFQHKKHVTPEPSPATDLLFFGYSSP
jgi:hypothetical protein